MTNERLPKRIVIFSGAGISAESGISTFRDHGGLWAEYRIEDVATPEAWRRDPQGVLRFYDQRRVQVLNAAPNAAHKAIADLENHFHVQVITQNIDDLHERAGSTRVLHLHGEIRKARSAVDPQLISPIEGAILPWGAKCAFGTQLRPHVVWFGEEVPELNPAAALIATADVLLVVGTSLQVYPAAGLVHCAPKHCAIHVIDPAPLSGLPPNTTHLTTSASNGVPLWAQDLKRQWGLSG